MTKLEVRTALAIGAIYLVRMLGLFMVLPVIAIAAPSYLNSSPLLLGLAVGIYGLTQALLQIPLGFLSDRIGRKKVLIGALLVFVAGSLIAAASSSIYLLILGRAMQGCGAIAGTLLALLSDLTRVEQRARAMTIVGGFIAISFGLALVAGPAIFNAAGLDAIFLVTAAAAVMGILLVLFAIPDPVLKSADPDVSSPKSMLLQVGKDQKLITVYISIFVLHYLLMASFVVFPVKLLESGVAVTEHAYYYLGILLASGVLMYPLMKMSSKPGYVLRVFLVAIVIIAIGSLLGLVSGDQLGIVAGITVFFVGFNLLEVVLPSLVARIAPAGARGTAMGFYATCQFAGVFAGGVVSGWILSVGDQDGVIMANVLICILWWLLISRMQNPGEASSRLVSIPRLDAVSANHFLEQLSSLKGVIDVAIIVDERVAYLKVMDETFDDDALKVVTQ